MVEIVEGDKVWFFHTFEGIQKDFDDGVFIYPGSIRLNSGTVSCIDKNKDCIIVHDEEAHIFFRFDSPFYELVIFRTKEIALENMLKNIKLLYVIVV